MHVVFIDLMIGYDRVNREAIMEIMKMYDVGGKPLNSIKNIYVNCLPCLRVKWVGACVSGSVGAFKCIYDAVVRG